MQSFELSSAFFVVLALLVLGLLLVAILWDVISDQIGDWSISQERIAFCSKCKTSLLTGRFESVVRCPRCNTLCSQKRW
jgi:uncharacterized paraquat-inducible protein A